MLATAYRECIVLLVGVAVSLLASLIGNAGRDFRELVVAILFPIAFCLIRTAMVRYPPADRPLLRRVGFQIVMAMVLVCLLLFEIGVTMLAGTPNLPLGIWLVMAAFGASYLFLFSVAHRIGYSRSHIAAG